MSDATFTFRVDEMLKSEFSNAAKARDRSGAQLLRDFMREFVQEQREAAAHDAWFRAQVQTGLDSANAGKLIPASDVEARLRPSALLLYADLKLPNDDAVLDARRGRRSHGDLCVHRGR